MCDSYSCTFEGSHDELSTHLQNCSYEKLKGFLGHTDDHIQQLQDELKRKDEVSILFNSYTCVYVCTIFYQHTFSSCYMGKSALPNVHAQGPRTRSAQGQVCTYQASVYISGSAQVPMLQTDALSKLLQAL